MARVAASRLHFPNLLRFEISGYQLFPGTNGTGIDFSLPKGVTVIAGINGLGKTTLLNALFRVLAGPVDWKKRADDAPAGSTPIELGKWRTPLYFQSRVGDVASAATIVALIGFGDRQIEITRSLRDLSVLSLLVDGDTTAPSQDAYEQAVLTLSGFASFDDFFLVLRYLVFFLEDRQPVIWDADAQSDLLRVLFFDANASSQSRALFDEIQRTDSQHRNQRVPFRRLATKLEEAKAKASGSPAVLAGFKATQTKLAALTAKAEAIEADRKQADMARRVHRLELEQAKLRFEEHRRAYEKEEQLHFASVFPQISEVAKYVLVQVGTGGGCLVCGNRGPRASEKVSAAVSDNRCPICDSTPEEQEKVIPRQRLSAKRLKRLDTESEKAQSNLAALETATTEAISRFDELSAKLVATYDEIQDAERELGVIEGHLPPSGKELHSLEQTVKALQGELLVLEAKRIKAERKFRVLLEAGALRIGALSEKIAAKFSVFAKHFLAEACDLQYEIDDRKIGQEGASFGFPRFTVRLTSATSDGSLTPRVEPNEVSESQKEFIDLAFRMALLEVAAGTDPTMMVLETPEASLDSIFVARAGQLLGAFASGGGEVGNRLIASSNLTKGDMISALLGALKPDGRRQGTLAGNYRLSPRERENRVVNLLEVAAPNLALKTYRKRYEQELRRAIYPSPRAKSPSGK